MASHENNTMERIQKVGELAITGASMVVYRAAELEQALDVPVPFFNALSVIVQKIRDHAAAVGENDSSVAEAGRRAGAIREVVERVVNADFPTDSRSLVLILEELAELESIASKWSEKGYWTKRLGVSFSAGTTKACKYDELFRKHFEVGGCRVGQTHCAYADVSPSTMPVTLPPLQLLEIYLHHFTNALQGEQYVEMKGAFEKEREERERSFRSLGSSIDHTQESMEHLRQDLVTMRGKLQTMEETLVSHLTDLEGALQQSFRDNHGDPGRIQAAVTAAVDSGVNEICNLLGLESEDRDRLRGSLAELADRLDRGFDQVNQKLDSNRKVMEAGNAKVMLPAHQPVQEIDPVSCS